MEEKKITRIAPLMCHNSKLFVLAGLSLERGWTGQVQGGAENLDAFLAMCL